MIQRDQLSKSELSESVSFYEKGTSLEAFFLTCVSFTQRLSFRTIEEFRDEKKVRQVGAEEIASSCLRGVQCNFVEIENH